MKKPGRERVGTALVHGAQRREFLDKKESLPDAQ
jgi:hypothetical protein